VNQSEETGTVRDQKRVSWTIPIPNLGRRFEIHKLGTASWPSPTEDNEQYEANIAANLWNSQKGKAWPCVAQCEGQS